MRGAKRAAATLLIEVDGANLIELRRKLLSHGPGLVGARIVGNRDPGIEREPTLEIIMKAMHALREIAFLVVDGNHDFDCRHVDRLDRHDYWQPAVPAPFRS